MPDTEPPAAPPEPRIIRTPPVDPALPKNLGIPDLDLEAGRAVGLLLGLLYEQVSKRFPAEATLWPLLSGRHQVRPYLSSQVVELPAGATGQPDPTAGRFMYPTGTILVAVEPIPGAGFNVLDGLLWITNIHVPVPANQDAHDSLRAMASVAPGGAVFVLSVEALKARDGAWLKDPAVVRQIEFNMARHRKLLGPDPEAVRKATVRPARVAKVLGIEQNALANGVERAKPGSRYARLAAGRTEGGYTYESIEMTAAEWGVGLQDDMDRLARLQELRKEIRAQIVAEATAVMEDAHTAPLEREACRKYLEKAGEIVWKVGPRR
jgi:hypothetical protein